MRIYELTSEGEWERAALPAVALVGVGLLPVIPCATCQCLSRVRGILHSPIEPLQGCFFLRGILRVCDRFRAARVVAAWEAVIGFA